MKGKKSEIPLFFLKRSFSFSFIFFFYRGCGGNFLFLFSVSFFGSLVVLLVKRLVANLVAFDFAIFGNACIYWASRCVVTWSFTWSFTWSVVGRWLVVYLVVLKNGVFGNACIY